MTSFSLDELVADLKPVTPVNGRHVLALCLAATLFAVSAVATRFGLRPDIAAGVPDPLVIVRSGTLLLLGFAGLAAIVRAARPGVGSASHGWRWALAAAALFPASALWLAMANGAMPWPDINDSNGPWCLGISGVSAVFIGALLTAWLRTGAPTNAVRSSWLIGLTAGAFGTFAYSLHCPSNTVAYIGIWYSSAIGLCAIAARLAAPRWLRW